MLGKRPNKVYDPFLKVGLGYQNPERLKKAIAAQPKMYDGERLHSTKLIIDSPNSKETLEDAEASRLKMKNKMIQFNYAKLNALYETFVPQKEFLLSKLIFQLLLLMYLLSQKNYIDDGQNTLRQFYKSDVIPMPLSLIKLSKELKQDLTEEVHKMLNIFELMEKKVETQSQKDNMFQNEIDRLLEASFTREIKDCVLIYVVEQKNEILMLEKEKNLSDSKDPSQFAQKNQNS
ncbi:hypothetical protein Tco_0849712 [Tanacetum coccineum]